MAKSMRSKIKRKFRAIKKAKYNNRVIDALQVNGTLDDPTLKKSYAKGFLPAAIERAELQKEKDSGMEAEGGDPSVTARGVAGAVHTDSAAAQIEAMRKGLALNRFKAGVAADDGETVPAEPMSQTQLNKLCKASRLKRYTQKKKNRRNITTQHNKRRTDKR